MHSLDRRYSSFLASRMEKQMTESKTKDKKPKENGKKEVKSSAKAAPVSTRRSARSTVADASGEPNKQISFDVSAGSKRTSAGSGELVMMLAMYAHVCLRIVCIWH